MFDINIFIYTSICIYRGFLERVAKKKIIIIKLCSIIIRDFISKGTAKMKK